ncbi:ankyrin repeat domain-containing protein [Aspergillus tanneri]|uniref:Uncharacterized protein n=1 Tax=Aspergillus tanneri TaxID=1220188 RepID=A0A5M9M9C5_9EURO|nr:uncharacterized protein ATNIH1004_011649 [Aspergillus tanneri]KAA8641513.1 hypothetical protein ATNIH1004_011649 [Aspergillus tanneri]
MSALNLAIKKKRIGTVELLLSRGAAIDTTDTDKHGQTPLHKAVRMNDYHGLIYILECNRLRGDGETFILQGDNRGKTALHYAAEAERKSDIEALTNPCWYESQKGINTLANKEDKRGRLAVDCLSKSGKVFNEEIANILYRLAQDRRDVFSSQSEFNPPIPGRFPDDTSSAHSSIIPSLNEDNSGELCDEALAQLERLKEPDRA